MRRKSTIALLVIVVLLVGAGYLALNGAQVGRYDIFPVAEGISLGLDLRGGVSAVYQAQDTTAEDFSERMDGTVAVLTSRLTSQGYTEAAVVRQGNDRIRIEIPDVKNPNDIVKIVGTPAKLEFTNPNGDTILSGEHIKTAKAGFNGTTPVVFFELNEEGSAIFAEETLKAVGQTITIKLDGKTITQPTVKEAITGGTGTIDGMESIEDAKNLALLIQSGALPLEIKEIELRAISPTLGVEALDRAVLAGIIGTAFVLLFLIAIYRLPGVVAAVALLIYLILLFFLLATVPGVQLSLPGIAGIILSIGMAVDANIIIFERMREELRAGKTLRTAMESGFKNAMSAIVDSNVTTILAALVLMYFGTGSVKGFAITLMIGVATSMVTAIFITRYLLRQMVNLGLKNRKLYAR